MKIIKKEYVLVYYVNVDDKNDDEANKYLKKYEEDMNLKSIKDKISSVKEYHIIPIKGGASAHNRVEKLEFEVEHDDKVT